MPINAEEFFKALGIDPQALRPLYSAPGINNEPVNRKGEPVPEIVTEYSQLGLCIRVTPDMAKLTGRTIHVYSYDGGEGWDYYNYSVFPNGEKKQVEGLRKLDTSP